MRSDSRRPLPRASRHPRPAGAFTLVRLLTAGLAAIAVSALVAGGLMVSVGAQPAAAAGYSSPSDQSPPAQSPYVLALWQGGKGQQWPAGGQVLIASAETASTDLAQLDSQAGECGTTYQVDLYANDATTQSLINGGRLQGPQNPAESWPGGSYQSSYSRVFTTAACPPVTPPAVATPSVSITESTPCIAVNGSPTLTVRADSLTSSRTYTIQLISAGGVVATRQVGGATTATEVFDAQRPGAAYTVKVTDDSDPYKTASASVTTKSCPSVGGVSLEVQQCTAPGGQGGLAITSAALVDGHVYEVRSGSATGPVLGSFSYATGQGPYTIPLPPGQSLRLWVVDQQGGFVQESDIPVDLVACPSTPTVVSVTPAVCTVGAASSVLTVRLGDLTVGRSYQLVYDNAPYGAPFSATAATDTKTIAAAAPGSHTVGVVDVADSVTSALVTVAVEACASQPRVTLDATVCAAPGGAVTLTATLQGLTPGRSYQATLTSGGVPVSGYPASTFTASAASSTVDYAGLAPGSSYRVRVVDTVDGRATASASRALAACPSVPKLAAVVASCNPMSTSSVIQGSVSELAAGQLWRVQLLVKDSAGTFVPVVDRPSSGVVDDAALRFTDVVNGARYRIMLTSVSTPALSAQTDITTAKCAVSGVEYTADPGDSPTRVSSLARTGTDALAPAIGALGVLLLGVSLLVISAIRRRKGAEN